MKVEKGRKQVGATIDEELYRLAKGCAAVQGCRVGEVIDDALREYLDKHGFGPSLGQKP